MTALTSNRVALVTGGTRGIGAAISRMMKESGYRVAATYVSNAEAAAAFQWQYDIPVFSWNVANSEECSKGVEAVTAALGSVEILVNNAGITRDCAFRKMTDSDWHDVIDTNLNSAFYMSRAVIEGMRDRQFGRIINISSINGQRGRYGQVNYSTAKAGMYGLTKALALEYARHGITVNAVAPGHIDTDIVRSAGQALVDSLIAENPVGRLGTPEEIARCVLFLASDDAAFMTGSTLTANGGAYML
ncbi:acetoacetyl-CoA reductase [Cupriavidus basilensis]|uniref:Acetoacetyl-CoA reductase n=1 Tax=Cupriavidus basilensis TaxID=68895 RepID=A0ABT6B4T4_9BURK|nr:acetoacetyl-CoA reductase [Cupriavidus basilensis]MDF3839900.1 acetoacetyl-CoA reductase [Cupriavidus basilensis]